MPKQWTLHYRGSFLSTLFTPQRCQHICMPFPAARSSHQSVFRKCRRTRLGRSMSSSSRPQTQMETDSFLEERRRPCSENLASQTKCCAMCVLYQFFSISHAPIPLPGALSVAAKPHFLLFCGSSITDLFYGL